MKTAIVAACTLMILGGVAHAQSSSSTAGNTANAPNSNTGTSSSSATSSMHGKPMRQQVKENLQNAGFKDVSVMPASFIVHAKDKNGNPTAMVVTPDSIFGITELASAGGANESSAQGTSNKSDQSTSNKSGQSTSNTK